MTLTAPTHKNRVLITHSKIYIHYKDLVMHAIACFIIFICKKLI